MPDSGNGLADWPLANLHGKAIAASFTSQSEFFKGKTETFPVLRFFLELTQHIPPKGCQYIRRYAPVRFPHQGKMAGQTVCGAAGSSGLELAPSAVAECSTVGALVNIGDYALRPPRSLADGEILSTGKHRVRFLQTPQIPHGWDAGLMFYEAAGTLLCSDLLHQNGDVEATTPDLGGVVERMRRMFLSCQQGLLAYYMPYSRRTDAILHELAALAPKACATMHGSTFLGDGRKAILEMAAMMKTTIGTL